MPSPRRRSVWAPAMVSSVTGDDVDLDNEVEAIVKLLKEKGPLPPSQIRQELATKYWGPGRLRAALAEARRRGLVRKTGRQFEASG